MSLTFGLFTQASDSGTQGPLVLYFAYILLSGMSGMGLLMVKNPSILNRVTALVYAGKSSFWHSIPLLFMMSQCNFTVVFIINGYML